MGTILCKSESQYVLNSQEIFFSDPIASPSIKKPNFPSKKPCTIINIFNQNQFQVLNQKGFGKQIRNLGVLKPKNSTKNIEKITKKLCDLKTFSLQMGSQLSES